MKSGGGSTSTSVSGTNGSDTLSIPAGYDIKQVSVNGRGGNDTLDLSNYHAPGATTTGVYVNLGSNDERSFDSVVADYSLTGIPASVTGNFVRGTIQSIESLIGTPGNDWLSVDVTGISARVDGGPGNDYIEVSNAASATLIGGSGSDWLHSLVPNSTLIGGSLVNGIIHEDAAGTAVDTFEIAFANETILDFQVGVDRLLFDATAIHPAFTGGTWVDNGSGGSTLMANGLAHVTLAGVPVSTAQTISYGFDYYSGAGGTFQGGPGNDALNCNPNYAESVVTGPGTGNDVVLGFTTSQDTLQFTSDTQVSWSDTDVNGQHALLGTFAGGSVTLNGLGTSDLSSIHIQGLSTPWIVDPTHHMSWWSVPSDAGLI